MNPLSNDSPEKLYSKLVSWFHLLTAPQDYAEEAEISQRVLVEACTNPPRTLLELGSGGGNTASHLKAHFQLTLTDISSDMLALSKTINPQSDHLLGHMCTLRLNRIFDTVLIQDAVSYMTILMTSSERLKLPMSIVNRVVRRFFAPFYPRNFRSLRSRR